MGYRIYLNNDWFFSQTFEETMLTERMPLRQAESVRLPHTVKELPTAYFDDSSCEMLCCYQRILHWDKSFEEKILRLTVEAAGHAAEVYLNGARLCEHNCGYTAFTVELTGLLRQGSNLITIKLDTHARKEIPPFGGVVDYLTYGGLYREVYLEVSHPMCIKDVFPKIRLIEDGVHMDCDIYVSGACQDQEVHTVQSIFSTSGKLLAKMPQDRGSYNIHNVSLWSPEHPELYILKTELIYEGQVTDSREDRIGFRQAEFRSDGFYLNGEKYKIRGLNRHQSYPYVGYAMPESMQKLDADLLKKELGLNAVRTSHYPQSHHFLDRCDELGLLVFTEIPGWQHIGDETWQDQAVENVKEMVLQYRNHPSIILWGVRINESQDCDAFYTRTNAIAHALDPTRQTSGVRYLKHSSLLEDVYAYNDFSYDGTNHGCLKKEDVTPDLTKGYLISEYNGHMYPTKTFDCAANRQEQALRHAAVMDGYYGEEDIAGGFGWCMTDYNTHRDFGSGDRVCHHGVMDMFRNRKCAGYVYAAQQEETPVLEITSPMELGDYPGANVGNIYAITNAEEVKVSLNGEVIGTYTRDNTPYENMPHGPILLKDLIKPLDPENKPEGNWGSQVATYQFDAIRDGQVIASVTRAPMRSVQLQAEPSHTVLIEGRTYDVAQVRIRALGDSGQLLSYFQEPVFVNVSGDLKLIGPSVISLKGGMGGIYVKTTGRAGKGTLMLSTNGANPVTIAFGVEKK